MPSYLGGLGAEPPIFCFRYQLFDAVLCTYLRRSSGFSYRAGPASFWAVGKNKREKRTRSSRGRTFNTSTELQAFVAPAVFLPGNSSVARSASGKQSEGRTKIDRFASIVSTSHNTLWLRLGQRFALP